MWYAQRCCARGSVGEKRRDVENRKEGRVPQAAGAFDDPYKSPFDTGGGLTPSRELPRGVRGVITAGESTCYVLLVARSLLSNNLAFPIRTHG